MSTKKAVGNLNREEWLERALDILSREGGAKLRVATLASEIGVTKGSFYWHFKDRDDFVRRLVHYWHERYILAVSDYLDEFEGDAKDKLRKLMAMVFVEQPGRHDLAIRSWAVAEPKLQELVKRTDQHRMNHLRMLFREIGFDKEGADLRARVFLAEAAWEAAFFEAMTKSKRQKKADALFDLLVLETSAG